jgi:hypothetical protein
LLVAGVFSFFPLISSFGQGTAFVYQGQLGSGGAAAHGTYDFQFTAYDAATNGTVVGGPVTNSSVAVSNGLFTTAIDFGAGVFTGPGRWLAIAVRTNGTTTFTPLFPTQPILPAPYAVFANSASNLVGVLPASSFTGGYTNTVALTNGANLFSGSFNGNGGALTNVNVTNLTGVLADNQLPTNTAFLNSNQTFTASNTFNGPGTFNGTNTFNGANVFTNMLGNSFSGSFFGNGLVGWIVVTGTTVQAQIDHGYLLTNSQIVTVTLPISANVGDIVRIAGAGASGWQLAQNTGQSVLGNFLSYGDNTWYQSGASALNWTAMASSADGSRMAAAIWQGANDGIYLSVNSGSTWTFSSGAGSKQFSAIAMSADGTKLVGVVTNGGFIYISTNSGSTWPVSPTAPGTNWSCVASSDSGDKLVAAVFGGRIYTFTTGGSWAPSATQPAQGNWTSVASSDSGNNLVASDANVGIYTSANGGGAWNLAFSSAKNWVSVASSADGTKLVAVVNGGGIYTSTNSGAGWAQTGAPSTSWSSVACSSDGSRLVATINSGIIYTSGNWGATWQTNNVPNSSWSCVASSSSGTTLAAGINNTTTGGIYTSTASLQTATSTTAGTGGFINGSQGSSVELQYIGNNQFMPVSFSGSIWSH